MSGVTGWLRLALLALRRDRVTLPAWVLGMAVFLAGTTAMFDASYADHPELLEPDTRIVVENPGMRVLGLRHRAQRRRLRAAPRRPGARRARRHDGNPGGRPAHPAGRGARAVGAGGRGGDRAVRLAGRGRRRGPGRRGGAGRRPRARPARGRAAGGGLVRRRRLDRPGRHGLHRRRRGHRPARVHDAWRDGDGGRGPRGLLRTRSPGQHGRDRGLGSPPRHERVARLAVPDRLGPADAAVRR